MKFHIAVLGATGYIGSPYRREIRECPDEARIVSVCARRLKRLEAAAQEDGAELFSDDWRQVIAHPAVNCVLVLTPDAHHHEAVMACAERGLHVVCEKPVGANAAEAQKMSAAFRDPGQGHFVPFWTRYAAAFLRAREIVAAGTLGTIRAFVYRWHNPRPESVPFTWRDDAAVSSAGSIADVGSHAYDALRWLLGEEAQRVLAHADIITPEKPDLGPIDLAEALAWVDRDDSAQTRKRRRSTAYDYASIAIEMQSGTVGTLVLSHAPYLRKGLAPELELHGTDASLSVDRLNGDVRLFRTNAEAETLAILPDKGLGNRFHKYAFPALRERIAGGSSEHPGLDDGYRAQLFTDAAACSARRGSWVDLSEIEAESKKK